MYVSLYRGYSHSMLKSLWLHPLSGTVNLQLECCKNAKKNPSKIGKSCCVIDCTKRFNKKSEPPFYRVPNAKEKRCKWIAAVHRNY